MRSDAEALINACATQIWDCWSNSNNSLNKRASETMEAKSKMQLQLHKVQILFIWTIFLHRNDFCGVFRHNKRYLMWKNTSISYEKPLTTRQIHLKLLKRVLRPVVIDLAWKFVGTFSSLNEKCFVIN